MADRPDPATGRAPWRPTLVDATCDAALRDDGFAIVRVLDASAAATLRTTYGDLHGWASRRHNDDQPPDFEVDFLNADLAYRRRAAAVVGDAVGDSLAALFAHHRPVFTSYHVKWPTVGVPPDWDDVPNRFHNDTTWIDESAGDHAYMVWIALHEVSVANGGLEVVPRSHRLPRTLRALDIAPSWLDHQPVFAAHAKAVHLAPGEALVFDPAIVHRSCWNHSPDPRVIAVALVAPPGAPLAYYRRLDDRRALRVDIDESVFLTANASDLWSAVGSATVDYHDAALSADDVERLLTEGSPATTSR